MTYAKGLRTAIKFRRSKMRGKCDIARYIARISRQKCYTWTVLVVADRGCVAPLTVYCNSAPMGTVKGSAGRTGTTFLPLFKCTRTDIVNTTFLAGYSTFLISGVMRNLRDLLLKLRTTGYEQKIFGDDSQETMETPEGL